MKNLKYILIALAVLALASCRENCYQPTRSLAGVGFINDSTRKTYTLKNLTVQGIGSDSVLYNNVSATAVYLPLHLEKDTTKYSFTVKDDSGKVASVDTLTIMHKLTPQLLNPECGCVPTYTITDYDFTDNGGQVADELYNPEVQNIEQDVHIKVYY